MLIFYFPTFKFWRTFHRYLREKLDCYLIKGNKIPYRLLLFRTHRGIATLIRLMHRCTFPHRRTRHFIHIIAKYVYVAFAHSSIQQCTSHTVLMYLQKIYTSTLALLFLFLSKPMWLRFQIGN